MKILITGGNGQLALALDRRLSSAPSGHTVIRADRSMLDISSRVECMKVLAELRPSVVLNCAAYTAVDRAESDRDAAFAINAHGAGFVAEAAQAVNAAMVHFSTDYVFDGKATRPYIESDVCSPLSVYGESKLAGERSVLSHHPASIVLRLSWVYSNDGANFYKTMLRLAAERPELRVVADQFGIPNFAGDIANAVAAMMPNSHAALLEHAGVYHLSAIGITNWHAFASEILARANLKQAPSVTPITTSDYPTAAKRPMFSALDGSRFAATFGWRFEPWQRGLDRCLAARIESA